MHDYLNTDKCHARLLHCHEAFGARLFAISQHRGVESNVCLRHLILFTFIIPKMLILVFLLENIWCFFEMFVIFCQNKDKVKMMFITHSGKHATCATLCFLRLTEADLRIGELQWGDSGVYFCKVVIADDLEGKNEAQLELLVLGMLLL